MGKGFVHTHSTTFKKNIWKQHKYKQLRHLPTLVPGLDVPCCSNLQWHLIQAEWNDKRVFIWFHMISYISLSYPCPTPGSPYLVSCLGCWWMLHDVGHIPVLAQQIEASHSCPPKLLARCNLYTMTFSWTCWSIVGCSLVTSNSWSFYKLLPSSENCSHPWNSSCGKE